MMEKGEPSVRSQCSAAVMSRSILTHLTTRLNASIGRLVNEEQSNHRTKHEKPFLFCLNKLRFREGCYFALYNYKYLHYLI